MKQLHLRFGGSSAAASDTKDSDNEGGGDPLTNTT